MQFGPHAFAVEATSVLAVSGLDSIAEWQHLVAMDRPQSIARLFQANPNRSAEMSIEVGDLLVDFSKHLVNNDIFQALFELSRVRQVETAWQQMCAGESINFTEHRAVGHIALRRRLGEDFIIDGRDVVAEVRATFDRMADLAKGIRTGVLTGSTGRRVRDVVNIGIGGSDLGPALMYEALRPFATNDIRCHFVSNVDPSDLATHLDELDPAETFVIIASKTFTTAETLANARAARDWLRATLGVEGADAHLLAVSANANEVAEFGVSADRFFPMWGWVGGRFSIGSAVGLSAMIALGPDHFGEFLEGQRLMDLHAGQSFDATNAPLVMALLGVWNRCVLGYATRAVVPYSYELRRLPAYLQQLIMESNGKSVRVDGAPVTHPTTPVIWGGVGTDAQHAFMQFLHQSPDVAPVDFLGFAQSLARDDERQTMLFMNMIAQAEALALGRPTVELPHQSFSGNRPSTVIVAPILTPKVLGQIIALYEHAVFFEGVILGINSFDQWGVELGKDLARALLSASKNGSARGFDGLMGSKHLLEWFDLNRAGEPSSRSIPETDR